MLVGRKGLLLLSILTTVSCGDDIAGEPDAGDDVDAGAGVGDGPDAGVDAPDDPPDLATLCGAEPTTLAEWEACYLERQCEVRVRCSERNLFSDLSECLDLADAASGGQLSFDAFERERAIAAGRASLDVSRFTRCLEELDSSECSASGRPPTCPLRFAGTIADGEACYSDIECESPGASCEPRDCGDSCCLGICQPLLALGEPCTDFGQCQPGLRCNLTTCVSGDPGSPCEQHYGCDPGAWCDKNEGICRPDRREGEPCANILQCGGETSCVGLFTAGEEPTCRRLTEAGDACDYFCLGNLHCDKSNPDPFGVCRPLPALDEPCGVNLPCVGRNLRCDSGTCVARSDVDEPCSGSTCLPALFCSDQLGEANPVCRERMPDGTSGCHQPAQCQSHICDGDENAPGECQPSQPTCP